ncbi:MAG: ATP-binding cassette domain-containing protein, partial [Lachnospiraceae bacterium]|nr:ATP-binding cassette domain-containing protein [Lachnospiraceae bacterium]
RVTRLRRRKIPILRRDIGVVFQDFRLLKDRNVYENIAFAQRVISAPPKKIRRNVAEVLTLTGISEKYRFFPDQLSGGEQQRVALARALVNRPKILLADEPTGNLDPGNSKIIMDILEEVNRRGTTVVVVTHNHEIVRQMNKRVINLKNGIVVNDIGEGGLHA